MILSRMLILGTVLCSLLLLSGQVQAVIETYDFSNAQLELRYQELSAELRCPKCQNQNIADSNAPIAQDLRKLLYQQLEEGASDEEILNYMVARYGEFVRYRPRFSGATAVLWMAPVLLLLVGIVVAFMALRSRRGDKAVTTAQLSDDEQRQLQALLEKTEQDS
jgi:cytochrome c-type biogenesis protein CcmH